MANLSKEKENFFYQHDIFHGAAAADRMQFIFSAGSP
jgi:hypothetical protein